MPKVSIITTTYKHEKFIAQTIDSILNQSFTEWELLIGDDSPDDATWHIIEEYTKKYPDKIRAWHHTPNKGIVENMNFLLEHISPETQYIAFLEGDDMYAPTNLEKKMNIFNEYPLVSLVFTDYLQVNALGVIKQRNNLLFRLKNRARLLQAGVHRLSLKKLLVVGNPIQSFGSVAVRKEVIERIFPVSVDGMGESMFGPFDYYLWLQILPEIQIYFLDQPLFLYRVHAGNFVKNSDIMFLHFEKIYEDIKLKNCNDSDIIRICNSFIVGLRMTNAFIMKDMKTFRRYFFDSWKYNKTKGVFLRIGMFIVSWIPDKLRYIFMGLYSKI